MKVKIQVREIRTGVYVVVLEGELDMSTSPEVRNAILPLFQKKATHIVVDLSGVPYIDSSGIATFVEGLQLSRKGGIRFTLGGASQAVESIFELAYLKNVFEMVPDVQRLLAGEESK